MWQDILDSVVREAAAHDRNWQRRRRSLSTLLVVLFVYRLAYSPQPRGYALILADLWECCRRLGIDLPHVIALSLAGNHHDRGAAQGAAPHAGHPLPGQRR